MGLDHYLAFHSLMLLQVDHVLLSRAPSLQVGIKDELCEPTDPPFQMGRWWGVKCGAFFQQARSWPRLLILAVEVAEEANEAPHE
eukprot:215297-Amphidinium_carterae.1